MFEATFMDRSIHELRHGAIMKIWILRHAHGVHGVINRNLLSKS